MKTPIALLILALTVASCDRMQDRYGTASTAPANQAGERPAAPMPPGQAAPNATAVTVNGEPIYMSQLIDPLVEVHGMPILRMLIDHKLVAQEAARSNITVTEQDVADEAAGALRRIFGDELTEDQRDRVLTKLLRERGMTRDLWRMAMWHNAALRKMIAPRIKITEPMLQAEFARQYGKKVQISHIRLPSAIETEKIIQLLKQGQDFAQLAKRYSTNTTTAAKGGLLPQFSRDDALIPQAIRETAFALEVGQISSIVQVENDFHVLKLHKRITPPRVDYQAVKESLRDNLQTWLIERMREDMIRRLKRNATIEYVDPALLKAVREQSKEPAER